MKKSIFAGILLVAAALIFAPAGVAHAKEMPTDGNIPLPSEYVPNEWLSNCIAWYDKNKDGILSPEEAAVVTELSVNPIDAEDTPYGVWLGDEIDLTIFQNLERVDLNLDSSKAPAGDFTIRIHVSSLTHLKSFHVKDWAKIGNAVVSGTDARIETIDFRGTTALEDVDVRDAVSVIFDSRHRIKRIYLNDVAQIPVAQITGGENLERLEVWTDDPDFTQINVAGNRALGSLSVESDRLAELDLTKNTKLQGLYIKSGKISSLHLKKNRKLKNLSVTCGKLRTLDLSANTKLTWLVIDKTPLKSLNLSKQKELTQLHVENNKNLGKLDLSKNTQIFTLYVQNTALKSLDVSKLGRLKWLEVTGNKKLTKLDLSKHKRLKVVDVSDNVLKTFKLPPKAKINFLNCSKNKLTSLDLSKATSLETLNCSENKLTVLDLPKTSRLERLYCSNNRLTSLDLSKSDCLEILYCSKNKLKKLDLSKAQDLKELTSDKKVKVKGYKGKITRV